MRKTAFEHPPVLGCDMALKLLHLPADTFMRETLPFIQPKVKVCSKATIASSEWFSGLCRNGRVHD